MAVLKLLKEQVTAEKETGHGHPFPHLSTPLQWLEKVFDALENFSIFVYNTHYHTLKMCDLIYAFRSE